MEKIKPRKRKRKKRNYLVRFVMLILIGAGGYLFLSSDFFDIQKITVLNNRYYTQQQVIALAEARIGDNMFALSTGSMKDKLLQDPYIRAVKISRRLPDNLVISVEERAESAAVPFDNDYVIIDGLGMILRKTDVEPKLTKLLGMTVANLETGTPLRVEENAVLNDTLKMLASMEENELYFKKIEISPMIIKAYIYDSLVCEGTPENIMKGMDGLKDVLYDLYAKGIERGIIKVGGDGHYSFSPEAK